MNGERKATYLVQKRQPTIDKRSLAQSVFTKSTIILDISSGFCS